jgi:hypothetical protein
MSHVTSIVLLPALPALAPVLIAAEAAAIAAHVGSAMMEANRAKSQFDETLRSLPTVVPTRVMQKEPLLEAIRDLGYHPTDFGNEVSVPGAKAEFRLNGEAYDYVGPSQMTEQDGEFLKRVVQRYAYHVTREQLAEQGFQLVEDRVEANQEIRLVLRRIG